MKFRFCAPAFVCFSVLASAGVASADDALSAPSQSHSTVVCHFNGADGGCSRFEGYVFVRHGSDVSGAQGVSVDGSYQGDAALSGQRLYLGVNSPSEH